MSRGEPNYVPVKRTADEAQGETGEPSAPNPVLIVHSLLRGRYVLAVVLATLLAAGGAVGGYLSQKPTYQSVGIIRIKPTIPSGLPTGQDRVMPAFEAFVKSQQAFLLGERVIAQAMEKAEWQAVNPGLTPEAVADFHDSLDVQYDKGELIRVCFTDRNPLVAMTAVKCVIDSYLELYGKAESDDGGERLAILLKVRTDLSNKLRAKNNAIAGIAGNDTDPETLAIMHAQSLQETATRESNWHEAQNQLAAIDTTDASAAATQPTTAPSAVAPEDIAMTDVGMRQLLSEQREATRALTLARTRYGPAHRAIKEAEQRLEMATHDVEEYAARYQRNAPLRPGTEALLRNPTEVQLQGLRVRERNLRQLYQESAAKTNRLGEKVVSIKQLRLDADAIKQDFDATDNAIRQLELQSSFSGRITAVSKGDPPLEPLEDKRKKMAAGGAMGGGMAGLALVLAIGFLNRRLVSVHDARLGMHRVDRMLGVLPHVPSDLADAEQAAVAAHCVHHIRTLLQLEPHLPARRVYSVTSPSPGDGKTTLTIALGMSFAASGAKTLLIDCDMIGGGLSSKMDQMIRPKIGRVLSREGIITEEQLRQALAAAERQSRPLGDVLVELGFASPADIAHAAAVQAQSYVGLLDVLGGEPLADCVTGTGRPGLFILPLGSAGAHHAGQLSPTALQSIVAQARAAYDVVLVDTGPILGSLEAAMAAAQSDGVVLAVSRGVPQALVRRSLDRLVEVGAYVVGMVLNRAAQREVADFAFSSTSVRSVDRRRLPPAEGAATPNIRLGTVGEAVASAASKTGGR
jgi:Mrp family chromosome partitioning ATPase/uncharacterized protein involved in exopolysaccharide biosynthesis